MPSPCPLPPGEEQVTLTNNLDDRGQEKVFGKCSNENYPAYYIISPAPGAFPSVGVFVPPLPAGKLRQTGRPGILVGLAGIAEL